MICAESSHVNTMLAGPTHLYPLNSDWSDIYGNTRLAKLLLSSIYIWRKSKDKCDLLNILKKGNAVHSSLLSFGKVNNWKPSFSWTVVVTGRSALCTTRHTPVETDTRNRRAWPLSHGQLCSRFYPLSFNEPRTYILARGWTFLSSKGSRS